MWNRGSRCIFSIAASLTALVVLATGLLLKFVMPPGSRGGRGLELWGFGRHDWGDLHYICSLVLLGLFAAYVFLRPRCVSGVGESPVADVCRSTNPITRARGLALLALTAAIVLGFLWTASLNLTRLPTGSHSGECTGEGRGAATQPTTVPARREPACEMRDSWTRHGRV